MIVARSSRYKNSLVFYDRSERFRDEFLTIGTRKTQLLLLTVFNNPYKTYDLISIPVANGTYKIKVISKDDKNNENSGNEGTVVITFLPLAPVDLAATLVGNTVTLTWNHSLNGAPDNYVVYGNGGTGTTINRSSALATVAGSALTTSFTVADGQWRFIVESIKTGVTSKTFRIVQLAVPVAAIIPPKPGPSGGGSPLAVTGLILENVSVGKVKLTFLWPFGSQAATFNVYHDDGLGTISYVTPKFTFTRLEQLIQTYTTAQLFATDVRTTYKFAVRAVTAAGVVETNTDEYSVEVDGKAPSNVVDLELNSLF